MITDLLFCVLDHIKYSLIIQIKLLRCGLLSEANEIASRMKELLIKYETVENIPENEDLCIADYEKLIKKSSGLSNRLLVKLTLQ